MDTNPFATPDSTGVTQPQASSYLQQTNNPTMTGGAANMIKALMAGNQKYQQMHPGGAMAGGDGQWMGSSSVGGAPLAGYQGVAPQMPMPPAASMQGGVPTHSMDATRVGGMPQPGASMDATPMGNGLPPAGSMNGQGTGGMMAPNPFMNGALPVSMDPVTQALMSPIPGM